MATNWTIAADQDSVDQVSDKIGESTDNETKATLFGKLWGIRNVVDWLKTNFMSFRASLTDSRIAKLDNLDILVRTNGSVVKSVQRGTLSISADSSTGTVTINTVDTSKSIVVYCGSIAYSQYGIGGAANSSLWDIQLYLSNGIITASRFSSTNSVGVYVSWQVIEFY